MKKSRILTFLLALCSIGMTSCVKYNGVPQESPIKLELSQTEFELIKGDGGKTFIPKLSSTEEEITNNKVSIEVKDKKIVSVDKKVAASGDLVRITALDYGETTITVTSQQDKDCKGTIAVTVLKTPSVVHVTDLEVTYEVTEDFLEMMEGDTLNIGDTDEADVKYTVIPEDANNKDVTYSANPAEVVTVDSNGVITAVGKGEGTVRITTIDKGISRDIPIKVKQDETLVVGAMYLVGTKTDWKPIKANEMSKNPDNEEYMITYQGEENEEVQMVKYNGVKPDESLDLTWYNADVEGRTDLAVTEGSNCKLITNKKVTFYIQFNNPGGKNHYWVALAS